MPSLQIYDLLGWYTKFVTFCLLFVRHVCKAFPTCIACPTNIAYPFYYVSMPKAYVIWHGVKHRFITFGKDGNKFYYVKVCCANMPKRHVTHVILTNLRCASHALPSLALQIEDLLGMAYKSLICMAWQV